MSDSQPRNYLKQMNMTASNHTWPVLTKDAQHHLRRISLPLGGIDTDTVRPQGAGCDIGAFEYAAP